ncbi:TonB-dependent receptor plug domain-containing protein [Sphingomonas turrisvirgatae]|uniref:TonB-dependent receptor plug domain-containing protein n=1 Tax=Sphingomonas turrisvirgatae TaxID=1888892 RepID=UPI00156AF587|nr:TonB-dependent receptor [Sphingomonas turrisvirgatae]
MLRLRYSLQVTAAFTAACFGGSALAQEVPAGTTPATEASDERDPRGEIVVTASRTATNGLQAPTPTQVVGAEVIEKQGATTVMEVLNLNPAFKATRSPGANATNTSSPAQATADLRALGGQRTLVLVNQSRVVPFAPASNLGVPTTTDLNLFPTLMIERVDVVTGGASALYGSDAVSGVVNIIMKKEYDGLQVTAQAGASQSGDYGNYRVGFVGGTSFNEGRGNIVLSGDYSYNDGVSDIYNRDWGREEWMIVTNSQRTVAGTAGFGQPNFILARNVHNSLGEDGVILNGATTTGGNIANIPGLTGMAFTANGGLRPYNKGAIFGGQTMIGGEGASIIKGTDLIPSVERMTLYGSLYYEFSDSLTAYVEGGYSTSTGILDGVPMRLASQRILRDNAYISPQVRALLPANLASFNISRIAYDIPNNVYEITNETPHGVVGFEGKFGGSWKWDAHVSYGVNNYSSATFLNPVTAKLNFAIDAVDQGQFQTGVANGNIVCRATLPGAAFNAAATGCVPINLFGAGNPSQAARDYILGSGLAEVKYDQLAAGVNLVGEPFATWAGPVVIAVGAEYRRETQALTADAVGSANGFLTAGNAVPYSGEFDVREGYFEATVPLARDTPFLRTLDLNGAVRYADYSTVGGQTAWKLGGVWEPVTGLNIRVSRSRDIRAPAINELASPGSNVTNSVVLVVDGVSKTATIPQNTSAGNPNAGAEYANTWTAGFAYRGSGALRGFGLSVDYYNIKIEDAITNLTTVNIASLCSSGDTYFCGLFSYGPDISTADPNDRIHTGLIAGSLNVGAFQQEGVDMTLTYGTSVGFLGDGGRYSLAASGTYIFNALVDTGTGAANAVIDRAGENGWANLSSIPTFRGNLSQTIGADGWELTLQTIFISKGTQDNTYNTLPTNTINDNTVPAVAYFNLFGKLFAGGNKKFELFWAVNNLFDKDPPPTPYAILNGPVNGQYYDKVGRNFTLGARVRF